MGGDFSFSFLLSFSTGVHDVACPLNNMKINIMYNISAETWRFSHSIFGPIPLRFLLPEQPGAFPGQGSACPERSGNRARVILE